MAHSEALSERRSSNAKHILIVEDEQVIADLLSDVLEEVGYCTAQASDGDSAIQLVQKCAPI